VSDRGDGRDVQGGRVSLTEEARASAMAMAKIWQRLADEQNQGSDLDEIPAPVAEQTQPVVQQQQQISPCRTTCPKGAAALTIRAIPIEAPHP